MTADNKVLSFSGHTTTDAAPVTPSVDTSAATAARTAILSTARAESVDDSTLVASTPTAAFYDPALLGVPGGDKGRAVWNITVTSSSRLDIKRNVLVDQVDGQIALQYDEVQRAESRRVCDAGNKVVDYTCPSKGAPLVASEASPPAATASADAAAAYAEVGGVYNFYKKVLGRDGVDGHGAALATTVRVCEDGDDCPMNNSFWDGSQLVFGEGFPQADDVVAHELTHGVTAATSALFYLYQSGAIDESMSDVMGELYDQWNGTGRDSDGSGGTTDYRWMFGEDLPSTVGVLRDMRSPGLVPTGVSTGNYTVQPDSMTSSHYLAQIDTKTGLPVDSGEVHINSGVGNKAAELMTDGGSLNGVHVAGFGGAALATRQAAITKTAHLFYLTDQSLSSGADYADLAATLSQACTQLVGHKLADGRGGTVTMGKSDCATVREAVSATRMTTNPTHGSAPEAPTCTKGTPQSFGFRDNFENTSVRLWKTTSGWYDPQIRYPGGDASYATSGRNELYGTDPGFSRNSTATMVKTYSVPIGKASYLRFDQAYLLDYLPAWNGDPALYLDGGRVEYSRNGGAWQSAAPLFDFGGYNGTVTGYSVDRLEYTFKGFGGDSHGYRSARLNLSSLAGSTVRVRFRLSSDSYGASYGWFVDDVDFYACGAKPSAVKVSARRGETVTALAWSPPADHGTSSLTRYAVTMVDRSTKRTIISTTVGAGVHKLQVVTLKGHKYWFSVAAYNKSGRGASGHAAV